MLIKQTIIILYYNLLW